MQNCRNLNRQKTLLSDFEISYKQFSMRQKEILWNLSLGKVFRARDHLDHTTKLYIDSFM